MQEVLDAWIQGNAAHMKSRDKRNPKVSWKTIHTDGEMIWSYGLVIGVTVVTEDGYAQKLAIPHKDKTKTTMQHIKGVLSVAPIHPKWREEND